MALSCERLAARRLLALLVAVLCIAGWIGVGGSGPRAEEEVSALAGPGLVYRSSADGDVRPEGPPAPDLLDPCLRDPVPLACARVLPPGVTTRAAARVRSRRGNPGAPRGPPLLVVS